jgi:hypothetical protein
MRNRSRSRAVRAPGTGGPAHFSSPRQKAHAADYPIPSASSVCQKCAWGRNVRHLCAGGRRCVSASCGTTAELLCQPGYRRPDRCWKCDPGARGSNCKGLEPLVQDCGQLSMYCERQDHGGQRPQCSGRVRQQHRGTGNGNACPENETLRTTKRIN